MIASRHRLSAVALMLIAALTLVACGSTAVTPSSVAATPSPIAATPSPIAATPSPAEGSSTPGPSAPVSVQNAVTIAGFAFTPATITVPVGTKVTWTNQDSANHTVTADDGKAFSSGNIGSGATFSFTFATAGTFPYHCAIHSNMTATVIVTP
jgi:plastocyanin